jgi:hypothetical protein
MLRKFLFLFVIIYIGCSSNKTHKQATVIPPSPPLDTSSTTPPVIPDDRFDVSKYKIAESELKKEREVMRIVEEQQAAVIPDSSSDSDLTESVPELYNITLADSSQEVKIIDSIDLAIFSLETKLFKNDNRLKKMKTYDTPTKIDYLLFLRKNNYKTTNDLQLIAEILLEVKQLEKSKYSVIMSTQSGNRREVIHKYIKKMNDEMNKLTDFVMRINKNEPVTIEYERVNPDFTINTK